MQHEVMKLLGSCQRVHQVSFQKSVLVKHISSHTHRVYVVSLPDKDFSLVKIKVDNVIKKDEHTPKRSLLTSQIDGFVM